MPERIFNGYSKLFEVRLLHHYWLDDGAAVFDLLPDERRKKLLQEYDLGRFMTVSPTPDTLKKMRGLGCIFRQTRTGFIVAVPGTNKLQADTGFEFCLTVTSAAFFEYTAMTTLPQGIHEAYAGERQRAYRIKENVQLFSNLTGAVRGSGGNRTLYLSREIPSLGPGDRVEALYMSGGALWQLTADKDTPGTTAAQKLDDDGNRLPVFSSQADIPQVVLPTGDDDIPRRGIILEEGMPDNLFAMIRLSATRPDDSDFSFLDDTGHGRQHPPIFHLRLKNRRSWWKRIARDGSSTLSGAPLPLTQFGNPAPAWRKPGDGAVRIEKDGSGHITRLVSEIFD